jgi:hypothetical protein
MTTPDPRPRVARRRGGAMRTHRARETTTALLERAHARLVICRDLTDEAQADCEVIRDLARALTASRDACVKAFDAIQRTGGAGGYTLRGDVESVCVTAPMRRALAGRVIVRPESGEDELRALIEEAGNTLQPFVLDA